MISDHLKWSQWSQMIWDGFNWSQMVSDGFSWSQMISVCLSWSQIVSAGLRLFQFVESTAIKRGSKAVRFHLVPTHTSEKSFEPRLSSLLCFWRKLLFILVRWLSSFMIALFMIKVAIYVDKMTEQFYDCFVYDWSC